MMRIMMLGRGVIATVYGWALERGGHRVEYAVRPGRAASSGERVALDLVDLRRRPWGERVRESLPIRIHEDLDAAADADLVIVSVSHHRLAEAMASLAPRVGSTTVLVFGNVWDAPASVVGAVPADQVEWGFPGAGGGFQPDGTLRAGILPSVRLGVLAAGLTSRGRAVREVFRSAGIRVRLQHDMIGWLGIHFATDVGMHAQGLRRGTLSRLVGDTDGLRDALLTAQELLPVLAARGIDLDRHRGATFPMRHPRLVAPALGWTTAHVGPARISLEAHTDPDAEEPRAVCRDALAAARALGITVPRLEAVEALTTA